ncbi:MAG: hypothetical protein J6M62_07240 [Selenomonadaceae bacterium]|nr:hypothetical protein [Selenomonadaceae bacterium]
MKKYSIRVKYTDAYGLITLTQDYKTIKFTLDEARAKANELLKRDDVNYCKIYKGKEYIETIDVFLGTF